MTYEGQRPLGDLGVGNTVILKLILMKCVGVDSVGSGWGPVAHACEHEMNPQVS